MQLLYSDRGLDGDSQLCLELSKVYEGYKTYTTAYAPGSNRMVERSDKTYKAILRALNVHGKKITGDKLLPFVFMAYDATTHTSTGFT